MRLAWNLSNCVTMGRAIQSLRYSDRSSSKKHSINGSIYMCIPALLVAIGISYLAAILFFLTLQKHSLGNITIWVVVPVILSTPLLVNSDYPEWRLILSLNAVTIAGKVFDLWHDPAGSKRFRLLAFTAYLTNIFCLVPRRHLKVLRTSVTPLLLRMLVGTTSLYLLIRLLLYVWQKNWGNVPFALEHLCKLPVAISLLWNVAYVGEAAWKLLGARTTHFMGNIITPHSPAEFWRRWNRPAQQFFYEDIFKPLKVKISPVKSILLVFFVNGLIHEYVVGIAIDSFPGYFLMFFLVHGIAVGLTWRLQKKQCNMFVCVSMTLSFNVCTSVLFFAGVNKVLPFYSGKLPAWLAF